MKRKFENIKNEREDLKQVINKRILPDMFTDNFNEQLKNLSSNMYSKNSSFYKHSLATTEHNIYNPSSTFKIENNEKKITNLSNFTNGIEINEIKSKKVSEDKKNTLKVIEALKTRIKEEKNKIQEKKINNKTHLNNEQIQLKKNKKFVKKSETISTQVTDYTKRSIYYLLLIIYYLLFIIYYLLFIIYYLLFIIYYLLFKMKQTV